MFQSSWIRETSFKVSSHRIDLKFFISTDTILYKRHWVVDPNWLRIFLIKRKCLEILKRNLVLCCTSFYVNNFIALLCTGLNINPHKDLNPETKYSSSVIEVFITLFIGVLIAVCYRCLSKIYCLNISTVTDLNILDKWNCDGEFSIQSFFPWLLSFQSFQQWLR